MFRKFNALINMHQLVSWLALASIILVGLEARAGTDGLTLSLTMDKPIVEHGEPVYLTATLKNTGSNAIPVFPSLYPEDSALQIAVTEPEGQTRAFIPYSLDLNDALAENLAPGESISAAFPVFYGGRGWTFRTIGEYQIQGAFVDPSQGKKMVESSPVTLKVSSSDQSGEYLMQGTKGSDEAGKFLLWQSGDHLRAGIAHLEDLIDRYPNSVLADHARLAFAHNLSKPFRDYSIDRLRKPDPDAAAQYLDKIKMDRLPVYLQVGYIATRARSLEIQGKTTKAKSVLEQAEPIIEKNPALKPLLERPEILKLYQPGNS